MELERSVCVWITADEMKEHKQKKRTLNAESNRENDLMTAFGNSFLRIF
jgi:RPA family protein